MSLNLCLLENHLQGKTTFTLQNIKTDYFNLQWMQTIIANLGLKFNP